jgi:hypothetical protein
MAKRPRNTNADNGSSNGGLESVPAFTEEAAQPPPIFDEHEAVLVEGALGEEILPMPIEPGGFVGAFMDGGPVDDEVVVDDTPKSSAFRVMDMLRASLQEEVNTLTSSAIERDAEIERLRAEVLDLSVQLAAARGSLLDASTTIAELEYQHSIDNIARSALESLKKCSLFQMVPGYKANQGKQTRILVMARNAGEAITKLVDGGVVDADDVNNLTKVTDKVHL